MGERLHKFMAAAGVASRRKCEEMIVQGRVTVDGKAVRKLGVVIDPEVNVVRVDGRRVSAQRSVTVVLHKPKGVLATMRDERGRPCVAALLPEMDVVLKPAGRLDKSAEGLMLFSTDGELIQRLTHPRFEVPRTYVCVVRGAAQDSAIERLRKGLYVPPEGEEPGFRAKPAEVEVISRDAERNRSTVRITVREGRKHQVKRMLKAVGAPVLDLKRLSIGPIRLGSLKPGQSRVLSKEDVRRLAKMVGLKR
ncbi:MAG: pseudouridine synthase [Armatimonadota bacterium]